MDKTIEGKAVCKSAQTLAHSLRAVSTLRLVLGLTALLGAIIFLEGTSWDIQWHSLIGRDRTLIPPHIMMLSGVALSGISGLLTVLIESWWARRNKIIAQYSVRFAEIFSGPLGAYIVGYTALTASVPFPLQACCSPAASSRLTLRSPGAGRQRSRVAATSCWQGSWRCLCNLPRTGCSALNA